MDPLFLSGCLVGFLFATFFGYVLGQIQRARNLAGAPDRPQLVQTPTIRTPRQVIQAAFNATLEIMGWVILLVVVSGMFLALLIYLPE